MTIATTVQGFSLDNIKANKFWTMYFLFFSRHCPKDLPHANSSALYCVNNGRPWVQFFPLNIFWNVGNDYSCTELFVRIFWKDIYLCSRSYLWLWTCDFINVFLIGFHVMHFYTRLWALLLLLLISDVPCVVKLPDYGLWPMYLLGVWFVEFLNERIKLGTC